MAENQEIVEAGHTPPLALRRAARLGPRFGIELCPYSAFLLDRASLRSAPDNRSLFSDSGQRGRSGIYAASENAARGERRRSAALGSRLLPGPFWNCLQRGVCRGGDCRCCSPVHPEPM